MRSITAAATAGCDSVWGATGAAGTGNTAAGAGSAGSGFGSSMPDSAIASTATTPTPINSHLRREPLDLAGAEAGGGAAAGAGSAMPSTGRRVPTSCETS